MPSGAPRTPPALLALNGQAMAGNTTANGYGHPHQLLRRELEPRAWGKPCPRCHHKMRRGQDLDLDHTDDRTGYLGMAHADCNRAAGARKRNARRRLKTSEDW